VRPQFTAVWVMGLTFSWFVIVPIDLFCIYQFHIIIDRWIFLCIVGIIILIIYLHYLRTNKWKQIIEKKPMLWNSHKLSIIFTIAFTVFGLAVFIVGMILGKKILESA
jgi:uncharacterized membrane protein YidH (DUF202 family)